MSFRDSPLGKRSLTADVELRQLYNPCLFYVGKVHYNAIEVYTMFSEILATGRLPFEPVFCSILGMFLCEGEGVGWSAGKGSSRGV